MEIKKWLIHLLGGYTQDDLPNLPAEVVDLTVVTHGGETRKITKADTRKRHSKNNTVIAFNVYVHGAYWGQMINKL